MVVFGLELFQQVESAVAEFFLGVMAAIGEEHGDGGVDHQQVQRCLRKVFPRLARRGAEGVVGLPIGRHIGLQHVLKLGYGRALQQLTESGPAAVVKLCQLREADVGEVLRTKPEEAPLRGVHGLEVELVLKIKILVAQAREIPLAEGILLVLFGNLTHFQQSRLSHEDGLYLEKVVAMMGHAAQRNAESPLLESLAVDSKPVVAGQRHEITCFPRTLATLHTLADGLGLLLQPFGLHGAHPGVHGQPRQFGNHPVTGRILVFAEQLLVVFLHLLRHLQFHLRQIFARGGNHVAVDAAGHMEHYILVGRVVVVAVLIPVARTLMDFHIAHP